MPNLELYMLGFIGLIVVIGVGWIIYDSREEDEK